MNENHDAGPILVCTDGSESARHAIDRARDVLRPAPAHVISVYEEPTSAWAPAVAGAAVAQFSVETQRVLADRARHAARAAVDDGVTRMREAGFEVTAETIHSRGRAWEAILAVAGDRHARLVVVGSRGWSAARAVLMGSVSRAVVHHSRHPLLVVRPDAEPGPGPVVLCTDASEHSSAAVDAAGRLLAAGDALAVHVWDPPAPVPVQAAHGGASDLPRELAEWEPAASEVGAEVAGATARDAIEAGFAADTYSPARAGGVAQQLADIADERGAAAIVIGSRGRGGVKGALLGSVSAGLLQAARRPLLIVPPRDEG